MAVLDRETNGILDESRDVNSRLEAFERVALHLKRDADRGRISAPGGDEALSGLRQRIAAVIRKAASRQK